MNKHLRVTIIGCLILLMLVVFAVSRPGTSQAYSPKKKHQEDGLFVHGRILVQFRPSLMALRQPNVIAEEGASDGGEIGETGVHLVELPEGADEEAFVNVFRARPEVEFAELDRIVPVQEMIPNDPWYSNWEWYLPKISAPAAWQTTTGVNSVTIAIVDTGVDGAHEDLASKLVPGWNVYGNNSDSSDVYGHGTKVAGTAAASSNNGMGVASVAWNCRIMPVRVSATDGTASYSNIATGLTWAANHGARVANVSYIVSGSSTVSSAAQYFQSKGGVVTVSAGNYSTFDSSPDNPYVLTVSATDPNDLLYSWSNTGNNVDVAAPGWSYTTVRGGGYSSASGTSISAPIVAGVAALVISANPSLTAPQVQDILKQSADDVGSSGWDASYGWGRVNAARAVGLAVGNTSPPPDTTPPAVGFSSPAPGATVSSTLSVQVTASDNVGVNLVSLSVDGTLVGGDNAAPYTFSWSTNTASNGTHTLMATASDVAGNTTNTSITVSVNNPLSDTLPPAINITAPANGSKVSGNVSVYVSATDNIGVVRVELYVDSKLVATSSASPFATKWNTRREASGSHTLQCKAYDAAGNSGTSALVRVYK